MNDSWLTSNLFPVFPSKPKPSVITRAEGAKIYTPNHGELLDLSAGSTHLSILGWNHPEVNNALFDQISKFSHIDYKAWFDPNTEALAALIVSNWENSASKLENTRVYFSGNSGAEACEAALKMSYQVHYDSGMKDKVWIISRNGSYHGSTSDALALGDRPNLSFYAPFLNPKRKRISMHHYSKLRLNDETEDSYARRCALELESAIVELGPNNVGAFIAETIMGGLVGDVPPVKNYFKYISEVCKKYDVHLILDEIYCGTGTTGKYFSCDYDDVNPDFLLLGKTLAAGYAPLSAVVTKREYLEIIDEKQGRLQHTTTHQAYSLGVAAALAVQKIVSNNLFLSRVANLGETARQQIENLLKDNPKFVEVRGRGLRFSIEHSIKNQIKFGESFETKMLEEHKLIVSAKWHRISITPPLIIQEVEFLDAIDKICAEFNKISKQYN